MLKPNLSFHKLSPVFLFLIPPLPRLYTTFSYAPDLVDYLKIKIYLFAPAVLVVPIVA